MKSKKQLGIWMDHSIAHLMALNNGSIVTSIVESQPKPLEDPQIIFKDESHTLNKEQGILSAYFNKLSDSILNYNEVILFGPTEAKSELLNLIRENHLFDKIKIEVKPADKMTENERTTFVKEYFNTSGQKKKKVM